MIITGSSILKKREDIVLAELDGKIVMMSIENGEYYGFNETATVLWEKIENNESVETLVKKMMDEYFVAEDECRTDVLELLEYLKNKNLIEIL